MKKNCRARTCMINQDKSNYVSLQNRMESFKSVSLISFFCLQLWSVSQVLQGENVRENLRGFKDPNLRDKCPLDLTYSMAEIAKRCVDHDLNSRTNVAGGFHGYVQGFNPQHCIEIHLTSLNGPYLLAKFLIADS